MAAYVIYQAEVLDPERYETYKPVAAEVSAGPEAGTSSPRRTIDVLEGEAPAGRTVVVEFPDRGTALEWYQGDYAKARGCGREQPSLACTSLTA